MIELTSAAAQTKKYGGEWKHRTQQGLFASLFISIVDGAFAAWLGISTATAQSTSATWTSQEGALQEVTVTARRQPEDQQKVPISITVLSGEEIREKNIVDPEDFNTTVPGLTVAPTSLDRASETYTIRGQGQILGGADPAVATYFNDVPTVVTSAGYLFDLENVQVLRGPQGTLFGVNSTGGAVLFVPRWPTNELAGYVDVTGGNYDARRYQVAVNLPAISDVLLVRLSGDLNYRDGYTINPVNGHRYDDIDYQAGRLGILYRGGTAFENYFSLNIATLNEHGAGNECIAYNPEGTFVNGAGDLAAACAAQQQYGPRYVNAWIPPNGDYIRVRNYAADNTTTLRLADDILVKNIAAYREYVYYQSYETWGTPFPVFDYSLVPNASAGLGVAQPSQISYSDELQVRGDSFGQRFHWQSGIYLDTLSPHSRADQDVATYYGVALVTFQSLNWKKRHALYGQGTYELADKVNLTMGARYTQDLRRQLTTGAGGEDLSAKFHATTWGVSLQYQLNNDVMLYATSRKGYKSGGFNNVAPYTGAQEFQPEYVIDGEVGAKTQFQAGDFKARINADVFYGRFNHWQERVIAIYPTPNGPLPFAVVANAAAGVVEGAELEATIIPSPHFELSGFYAYLNPYFTSNTVDGQNYVASPIAQTVKHKTAATVRYLFGLPETIGDMSVAATYAWQSTQTGVLFLGTSPTTDPNHGLLPAYGLLNLRAEWQGVLGHRLDLSAFCENVTNKIYLTDMNNAWTLGEDIGQYGPPRMYGISVRVRL